MSGCKCNFSSADCYSKELLLDAIKLVLEKIKLAHLCYKEIFV